MRWAVRLFVAALVTVLGFLFLALPQFLVAKQIERTFAFAALPDPPTIPYTPETQPGEIMYQPSSTKVFYDLLGCSELVEINWGPTGLDWSIALVECASREATAEALSLLSDGGQPYLGSNIFSGADENFTYENLRFKAWIQGNYVAFVATSCTEPHCMSRLDQLAREYADQLPERPRQTGAEGTMLLILVLVIIGVIAVMIPRIVQFFTRQKLHSPSVTVRHDGLRVYIDDSKEVRRARRAFTWTRRFRLLFFIGSVASLGAFSVIERQSDVITAIVTATITLAFATGWLIVRSKIPKLPSAPKVISTRPLVWIGEGIVDGMRIVVAFWLLVLFFGLLAVIGSSSTTVGSAYLNFVSSPGWPSIPKLWTTLILVWTKYPLVASLAYLTLPAVIFAYVDRLGRRLAAPTSDELLTADPRPPVLYLRSFDEDSLTLDATISQQGFAHRLMPWRRRRFEEFLAGELNRIGPVVAISPPGTRVPPLGAARMTLGGDEWQARVHELTQRAVGIVMSATPSSIREGLHWEIGYLGTQATHGRVMLVVSPWKKDEVRRRLGTFVDVASTFPLFRTLPTIPYTEGVHVMWRDSSGNWRAVGADHRSDVSYRIILGRVVQENWDVWRGGIAQQYGWSVH